MVGVATGAGLSVKGGLDTSMIERGFDRVRQSFESVKGQAKSFTSDLTRMNLASSGLVKQLGRVGLIGTSAIIGLASQAPAVAGSMAKISLETDRLIRTLGTQFAPEFAKVSEMYTKFVNFVAANPDLTKGFVFSSTAILGFSAASKFLTTISSIVIPAGLSSVLTSLSKFVAPVFVGTTIKNIVENREERFGEGYSPTERFKENVGKLGDMGTAVVKFFKDLIGSEAEGNPDLE